MVGSIPWISDQIRTFFERNFRFLCLSDVRPIGDAAKEGAFTQVMNYFHQNQAEMRRVIQTEVDVSLEKDGYILVGKVDLLMGQDSKLELLDFKTSERSTDPALVVHLRGSALHLCPRAGAAARQTPRTPLALLDRRAGQISRADGNSLSPRKSGGGRAAV